MSLPAARPDHLNYLCMNYTRPVPLRCTKAAEGWKPRWFTNNKSRPRFVIHAWWDPVPSDYEAYADAGFNLVQTENGVGAMCNARGVNATIKHDDVFETIVSLSDRLAKLGLVRCQLPTPCPLGRCRAPSPPPCSPRG